MRVYDYTKGIHMPSIVAERVIRTTTIGLATGEPPAVWCTVDSLWAGSITARCGPRAAGLRWMASEVGAYRIEVDASVTPMRWRAFKDQYLATDHARSLERAARTVQDNPNDWRIALASIPRTEWRAVEVYEDERWQDAGLTW